jgi:hypothetical protein
MSKVELILQKSSSFQNKNLNSLEFYKLVFVFALVFCKLNINKTGGFMKTNLRQIAVDIANTRNSYNLEKHDAITVMILN